MKRVISLILVCLSMFSFSACGKEEKVREPDERPSSENTSSVDLEQVYEESLETLDEMHQTALETICEQIRPNTSFTVMSDGIVIFMLPIEDDVSVDNLTEAYNTIYDYIPTFAFTYPVTGAEKFVFRISDNKGKMVLEVSIDFSSESENIGITYNPEYAEIVQQLLIDNQE